jgi:hypothetical protein
MYSYVLSPPYTEDYQRSMPEISYLLAASFENTANPSFFIKPAQTEGVGKSVNDYMVWIKADYEGSPKFQALGSNLRIPSHLINVYQEPTGYSTTKTQEQKVYSTPGTNEYVLEMIGFDLYGRISQEDREFLKIASNMFNIGEKVDIKRIFNHIRKLEDE